MHKIAIVLAAGSTIFDIPGPNGVLVDEAAIVFEVEENVGIDPYDDVAHGLIAGGRADLLPQLTHNATVLRTDKENGQESEVEVSVAYLPTGARVERSAEEVAESEASIEENELHGEDPRVDPLASSPIPDARVRDPFANSDEPEVAGGPTRSNIGDEPKAGNTEEAGKELVPPSVPNFATSEEADQAFRETGIRDLSGPGNPRADGSYGYLEPETPQTPALEQEAGGTPHPVVQEIRENPNVAATLAGELQLENLSRDDLNDVARIAYGFPDPTVYENRDQVIDVIRKAQAELARNPIAE